MASIKPSPSQLYDHDYYAWIRDQVRALRERRIEEVDWENVAEEIEDLGKSDRRGVSSQLRRMLLHMVKQRMQPERDGSSWESSINSSRWEILFDLKASPSLRKYLKDNLQDIYTSAVIDAVAEMKLPASETAEIPRQCPYTLDQLLEGNPAPWR